MHYSKSFFLHLFLCFSNLIFAQEIDYNQKQPKQSFDFSVPPLNFDSIVSGDSGAFYAHNHIIIRFNPQLINPQIIDNVEIKAGNVQLFIKPEFLDLITDEYQSIFEKMGRLPLYKIFQNLTTTQTVSISRLGNEVQVPKFWSTFVLVWDSTLTGLGFNDAIDSLNKLKGIVEYAVPNYVVTLHSVPNDPLYQYRNVQNDLRHANLQSTAISGHINIEQAWTLTQGGFSEIPVRVGVYDTGINWEHEDFSEDNSRTFPKSRVKGGAWYSKEIERTPSEYKDYNGHGTNVAGIIGAIRNNDIGMAGIAGGNAAQFKWGCELYALRVFEGGPFPPGPLEEIGFVSNIANALFEGASSKTMDPIYHELDVMSCSWQARPANSSADGLEPILEQIIYAIKNDVVMVFSAGNNGGSDITYPASYRDDLLIKVGGSNQFGSRYIAQFYGSNYGHNMDVIAPGVPSGYIQTLAHNSNTTYTSFGHTSAACPHVSGLASLIIGYLRENRTTVPNLLSPEDIEKIIEMSAPNASTGYNMSEAWGLINASAALQSIQLPKKFVKHYAVNFNNNDAVLIEQNKPITILDNISTAINQNALSEIKKGTYLANIYEVKKTINITQPTGNIVHNVWPINAQSTLYDLNNFNVTAGTASTVSWNQSQTSVEIKGYIYELTFDVANNIPFNEWLPAKAKQLQGNGTMKLSAYIVPTFASGLASITSESSLTVFPNPGSGNISIQIQNNSSSSLDFEIVDVSGKTVFSDKVAQTNGVFQLNPQLTQGVYLLKVKANEKVFTHKLIVTP